MPIVSKTSEVKPQPLSPEHVCETANKGKSLKLEPKLHHARELMNRGEYQLALGVLPAVNSDLEVRNVCAVCFIRLHRFAEAIDLLRTVTLNKYRELRRKWKLDFIDASQSALAQLPDDKTLESTWDTDYRRELVGRAIELSRKDFSESTWAALKALISSGRPAAEIAEQFGLSVWTIYSAKARLIQRLRRDLTGLME